MQHSEGVSEQPEGSQVKRKKKGMRQAGAQDEGQNRDGDSGAPVAALVRESSDEGSAWNEDSGGDTSSDRGDMPSRTRQPLRRLPGRRTRSNVRAVQDSESASEQPERSRVRRKNKGKRKERAATRARPRAPLTTIDKVGWNSMVIRGFCIDAS